MRLTVVTCLFSWPARDPIMSEKRSPSKSQSTSTLVDLTAECLLPLAPSAISVQHLVFLRLPPSLPPSSPAPRRLKRKEPTFGPNRNSRTSKKARPRAEERRVG